MARHHGNNPRLSDRERSRELGSLRYLLAYLRSYKLAITGAMLALIFTSFSVLAMGSGLRYLIDEGLTQNNHDLLNRAFFLMLGVVVLLAVATYFRFMLVTWVGERTVSDIRRDIYARIIQLHLGYFETARTGEILSRMTTDTTLLQGVVGSSVSVALRNGLMLLGGIIMLLYTSPALTAYVGIIVPLVIIPILTLGKKVRILSRATQDRVADLASQAEETVSGIRTIQALSLETHKNREFGSLLDNILGISYQRIRMRALLTAIVIILVFGAIITVLWIGGHRVLSGEMSPGALSAFVFYSVVVAGAVGALSEVIGDLQRAAGAAERLMEIMKTEPAIRSPAEPLPIPQPLRGELAFNDVIFHYPARPDKPALNHISLTIHEGETVAVVGPSGAGKTTLFQLLLRFYDPASGNVTIDGTPIHLLAPEAWRSAIGLVPQEPVIFSANAWDNIRCGRQGASDEDVLRAAEGASARDFLEQLPDGLNSFLGEKGVRLSGGQRQRIAIARAMIRNPRILLLDEATNALDAQSERLVQDALEVLMKGRTTLVIAHRLSTVLNADRIVVMQNGHIEAMGTHQELLAKSPLYARLAALQFDMAEA